MKNESKLYPLSDARALADQLVDRLYPGCVRIEVAGSVRREKAQVHDIDLVAWPMREQIETPSLLGESVTTTGGPDRLVAILKTMTREVIHSTADSKILHFAFNGIPVEIYLAEPDGSNFEALLQMRTGSEFHNKMLARRAYQLKMFYHAGYGIYRIGPDMRYSIRVDDGTEQGVYAALMLPYLQPQIRN